MDQEQRQNSTRLALFNQVLQEENGNGSLHSSLFSLRTGNSCEMFVSSEAVQGNVPLVHHELAVAGKVNVIKQN